MSGEANTHSALYVNSIPAGSPYMCDTVTIGNTLTVGDTLSDDHSGWVISGDTCWLNSGTITLNGTVELEEKMHVYEVIAVNRRTFVMQEMPKVVASSRDKALLKAVAAVSNGDIKIDFEEWHIEVRQLFSFEPIEERND